MLPYVKLSTLLCGAPPTIFAKGKSAASERLVRASHSALEAYHEEAGNEGLAGKEQTFPYSVSSMLIYGRGSVNTKYGSAFK
jgi:hypothetical protein